MSDFVVTHMTLIVGTFSPNQNQRALSAGLWEEAVKCGTTGRILRYLMMERASPQDTVTNPRGDQSCVLLRSPSKHQVKTTELHLKICLIWKLKKKKNREMEKNVCESGGKLHFSDFHQIVRETEGIDMDLGLHHHQFLLLLNFHFSRVQNRKRN